MREKTHSEHLGRFDSANPVTETELYVPILEIAPEKKWTMEPLPK